MSRSSQTVSILMVHCGDAQLPEYLVDNVVITLKIAPASQLYVLSSRRNIEKLHSECRLRAKEANFERVICLPIEDIPSGALTVEHRSISVLDRGFRAGFWFSASERFFVIADAMRLLGLENCIHIENDVVLYFDPTEKLEQLRAFSDFSVPLDRIRAIPGIVWFKNASIADQLAQYILQNPAKSDMFTLGEFCILDNVNARPFPTLPETYALAHKLDFKRYCDGIEQFGGIFDGAAIGQYVGGIHWMNNPADTRFFMNESSDLNMSECQFSWAQEQGARRPTISYGNSDVKILSIHAHSKDIQGVSPYNTGVPVGVDSLITGERFQALADLTISSSSVTQFHGQENIQSVDLLEIPIKETKKFFKTIKSEAEPDEGFLERCKKAKVIFVYTHLLQYFKKFIAPRLRTPFVLITHNSDNGVTMADLDLLNQPNLLNWYAQNVDFCHVKLKAIPIGLANQQWGSEKLCCIFQASKQYRKSKLIFANFILTTHPERGHVLDEIAQVEGVTSSARVSFEKYAQDLAEHFFCLCPRGNGIDTHRFWEAQYLGCIPIVLKQDWTSAYSNLPILLIDSWSDLKQFDLQKKYIQLSSTFFDFSGLTMEFHAHQIRASLSQPSP